MSDPSTEPTAAEPGVAAPLPLAVPIAVVGALLHQIAVYAPVFEVGAGPEAFSPAIVSFTDGVRAALPHLAVTLLGIVGALVVTHARGLGAGLLGGAGTMALITFAIAGRGVWWTAAAGDLPLRPRFGLFLGIAGAALLLAAAVLALHGVVSARARALPAAVIASFLLGGWLLPWLAWRTADGETPSGLAVGAFVWLGRSLIATVFVAFVVMVAGWRLSGSPALLRGAAALAALAVLLVGVGTIVGWSVVRILHAAAWGTLGAVVGLCLVAVVSAAARADLPTVLAVGGLGLLLAGLLLPELTTVGVAGPATFRPIPLGDAPLAELQAGMINEAAPIALAALGATLLGHRGLGAGLLIGAAVAAVPWGLLFPVLRVEVGMWLRIGGLALVLAAAWTALRPAVPTSERPGSAPPSPR